MAKIGYIRCSALDQNEARQVEMMKDRNVERVYMDKASGKNTNREQLQAMTDYIREGDIIITESISRIARNTRDLLSIVSEITEKKAEFVSLKENIDTSTPQGRFMLTVFAAMAELERESILERQREGIAIAKAEGKTLEDSRLKLMKNALELYVNGGVQEKSQHVQLWMNWA